MSLQDYLSKFEEFESTIMVRMDGIRFADGQMANAWYTGRLSINFLTIRTDRLHTIQSNAFDDLAFHTLTYLMLLIHGGMLTICDGALDGTKFLTWFHVDVPVVSTIPLGLFDEQATLMWAIKYTAWPNHINLNGMFAGQIYRSLKWLQIQNVRLPQTRFRYLHMSNFTAFRRLQFLIMTNCGIEVIDEHAFSYIGRSLEVINLNDNWIKMFNVQMFRTAFETKQSLLLTIDSSRARIQCTCDLLEMLVMQCPHSDDWCTVCDRSDGFQDASCGVYRMVQIAKYDNRSANDAFMRVVSIRMAYDGVSVAIHTNFTSGIRVLLVNGDAMLANAGECTERVTKMNFKCFRMGKNIRRLELGSIDEIRYAKMVSITVIPILYQFAARPMHSMTVRQSIERPIWIDELELVILCIISCILSASVGFVATIGAARIAFLVKTSL